MDATNKTIDLLGSKVNYLEYNQNKADTIVMIHGLRGTHHGLQKIIKELSNFHIIIPDLPGFGGSTPMQEHQHDITGYSKFVQQFIKKTSPKKPILLGHSFGSIITSNIAANSPDLISKLILINPIATKPLRAFTGITRVYHKLSTILPEKTGKFILGNKGLVMATSLAMAKTKDKDLRKDIHKSHLTHFSRFHTTDVLYQAFKASISHTVTENAEKITHPTLLIAGSIDDIAPAKGQYKLETIIPDCKLVMLDKVGHLIHYETPKQAAQAIKDFLE